MIPTTKQLIIFTDEIPKMAFTETMVKEPSFLSASKAKQVAPASCRRFFSLYVLWHSLMLFVFIEAQIYEDKYVL